LQLQKKKVAINICFVSTVLYKYANKLGFSYDDNGKLARGGFVDEKLLNDLKFYKSSKPKSLGVEFLTLEIFSLLNSFSLSNVGVLRTFIERIAIQVTQKIKKKVFLLQVEELIHFFCWKEFGIWELILK